MHLCIEAKPLDLYEFNTGGNSALQKAYIFQAARASIKDKRRKGRSCNTTTILFSGRLPGTEGLSSETLWRKLAMER